MGIVNSAKGESTSRRRCLFMRSSLSADYVQLWQVSSF